MKYAIIKASGRQLMVKEGDEVELDKIDLEVGKKIKFEEVLLLVDGKKVQIGQPYLKGVVVQGKVLAHLKGKKIRVATFKAKSRYRRVKGFRARLTSVKIEKIGKTKTSRSTKTG